MRRISLEGIVQQSNLRQQLSRAVRVKFLMDYDNGPESCGGVVYLHVRNEDGTISLATPENVEDFLVAMEEGFINLCDALTKVLTETANCQIRPISYSLDKSVRDDALECAALIADKNEHLYVADMELALAAGRTVHECNRLDAKAQMARQIAAAIRNLKSEARGRDGSDSI